MSESSKARNVCRRLPDSVFHYATEELWLGRKFGEALKHRLAPNAFSAWTWTAPDVGDARLAEFRVGGLRRHGDVWSDAVSEVSREMSLDTARLWVVPHPLARPGDPFLQKSTCEYSVVD